MATDVVSTKPFATTVSAVTVALEVAVTDGALIELVAVVVVGLMVALDVAVIDGASIRAVAVVSPASTVVSEFGWGTKAVPWIVCGVISAEIEIVGAGMSTVTTISACRRTLGSTKATFRTRFERSTSDCPSE